jgi:carbohydrate-binding DOMON domain-containing protein
MSKTSSQPLANALSKVVDLLVESRIRIDAMEQILVKTNSVAYPLYLGMIENLQRQKATDVNRVLTRMLKSKPTQG